MQHGIISHYKISYNIILNHIKQDKYILYNIHRISHDLQWYRTFIQRTV